MTVSDESKKLLDQVKKGKPRNFAIVTKGVKIVALLVKKKPIKTAEAKELKKSTKGQEIYIGVVEGKGQDIRFKLKAEDTEKPPGKELMLKDFLLSQADFKCKPSYEIVRELTEVDEGDDDGEVEETSDVAPDADPRAKALAEELGKYEKLVPVFVRTFADRRVEILKPVKQVKDFAEGVEGISLAEAETALATVKSLLAELQTARAGERDSSPSGQEVVQRLKAMSGAIKAGLAGPDASRIQPLVENMKSLVGNKDYQQAGRVLDQLETLLSTTSPSRETLSGLVDEVLKDMATRANSLDQALARWKSAQGDVATELKSIEKEISSEDDPEVTQALIELKAVRSQLSGTPDTVRKVEEMHRYLVQDDVVFDVCELAYDFRTPLVGVLGEIKAALTR